MITLSKKSILWIILSVAVLLVFAFLFSGKYLMTSVFSGDKTYVTLHTNKGDIEIKLYHDLTPNIAENFQRLAEAGKYDNTIFHRVINGFMIQGGDYEKGNGTGGAAFNGGLLPDEIHPSLSHTRGKVSMANRGPDTNGSQFFIVQRDAVFLDGRFSLFGEVIRGMDTVDAIASTRTDANDKPLEPIIINHVTVSSTPSAEAVPQ